MEGYPDEIDEDSVKKCMKYTVATSTVISLISIISSIGIGMRNIKIPCHNFSRSAGNMIFGDSYWLSKPFILFVLFVFIIGWFGILRDRKRFTTWFAVLKILILLMFAFATLVIYSANNHLFEAMEDPNFLEKTIGIRDDANLGYSYSPRGERAVSRTARPSHSDHQMKGPMMALERDFGCEKDMRDDKFREFEKNKCKVELIKEMHFAINLAQIIYTISFFLMLFDAINTIIYTCILSCNCEEEDNITLKGERTRELYTIVNGELVPYNICN